MISPWVYLVLAAIALFGFAWLFGHDRWVLQRRAFKVIGALRTEPRGMTYAAIADMTQIEASMLSHLLQRLCDDGVIDRYEVRGVHLYKLRRLHDL